MLGLREGELIALLKENTPPTKLQECAEEIRLAQLRALKAKRDRLPPCEKSARAIKNIDTAVKFWASASVAMIVEGYRGGKFQQTRPSRVIRGYWNA